MERAEGEEEIMGLPRGHLAAFVASLTPEQKRLWRPIRRVMKQARSLTKVRPESTPKEQLYEALNAAQGTVTVEKIEKLLDNAVEKGDVQALRVMAQMAGMDLMERPKETVGEGAKVIIVRPRSVLPTLEDAVLQTEIVPSGVVL